MSDTTSQKPHPINAPASEPWGPLPGLDPVQEYRLLAHELQEAFPDAEPRHLDRMVAREMALYGGYSAAVIAQAMGAASLYLAANPAGNVSAYIDRTVDEAMQPDSDAPGVLGWGA